MLASYNQSKAGTKAFLIARVSDSSQRDALPAQEIRLNDYANKNNFDHQLFSFDETAYKEDRLKFEEIAQIIATYPQFCVVVFDKIDRFSRDSSSEIVRVFKNLVKQGRIELHFPSDGLIYHKDSPACDITRLGMGMVFGEYYSAAISDNVKRKIGQKLRDGEWIGKAPFGYRNIIKDGRKWVEPDDNAIIIRSMFEKYASGTYSMYAIRDWLNEAYGLNKGKSWVEWALKNPFYYGVMRIKGILYPHKYEPIISKKLFDSAQAQAKSFNKTQYKYAGKPYLYRGLITCNECGCRITPECTKGHVYYHCTQYKGKHNAQYIREEELTKQLLAAVRSLQPTEEQYNEVLDTLKVSHQDKIAFKAKQNAHIQSELSKINNRIERLFDVYLDGVIEKEEHSRIYNNYIQQKTSYEEQLKALDEASETYYDDIITIMDLAKNAPLLFKNCSEPEDKRRFLNMLFQNLELNGKQLGWKYKKPFDLMASCNDFSNWLPLLDVSRTIMREIHHVINVHEAITNMPQIARNIK